MECPECAAKAIIKKTNRKHRKISDIYCVFSDVECWHTFVMNLTFPHILSPSAKTGDMLIQTLINTMSPEQRQMALDILRTTPIA
ncbi:ogr/Delta-like zinc finger family protein [Enterobacter sp. Bisph1]|uniref:ogr/Delta-like zinc finger family protein n=1 Tax=Enterobacter sp. Bisph1 TaxID=1274399 RepID=UPI000907C493|nr:ogr/Delta-like zinc finger family protein [Enterobacter sp. Bisph1]